jgi:hypothetical protein
MPNLDMPRAFPWFSCLIVCKLKAIHCSLLALACGETSFELRWEKSLKKVVHSVITSLQTSIALFKSRWQHIIVPKCFMDLFIDISILRRYSQGDDICFRAPFHVAELIMSFLHVKGWLLLFSPSSSHCINEAGSVHMLSEEKNCLVV